MAQTFHKRKTIPDEEGNFRVVKDSFVDFKRDPKDIKPPGKASEFASKSPAQQKKIKAGIASALSRKKAEEEINKRKRRNSLTKKRQKITF